MLFDIAFLRRNTDGDTALEKELLMHFETTLTRCLSLLESSDTGHAALLHELKGAARTMGAKALASLCEQGETKAITPFELLIELKKIAPLTLQAMHRLI